MKDLDIINSLEEAATTSFHDFLEDVVTDEGEDVTKTVHSDMTTISQLSSKILNVQFFCRAELDVASAVGAQSPVK